MKTEVVQNPHIVIGFYDCFVFVTCTSSSRFSSGRLVL